tara:strand:- start:388 stop:597 length:210 start_codon:yes stop_codon:yes gene_type:complete
MLRGFVNGKAHPTAADIALFDIVTSPFPGLKGLSSPSLALTLALKMIRFFTSTYYIEVHVHAYVHICLS